MQKEREEKNNWIKQNNQKEKPIYLNSKIMNTNKCERYNKKEMN